MAKEKKGRITSPAEFEARFGARRVDVRNKVAESGFWSTGSFKLDRFLGGGLPKGKLVMIEGPPGSGKSTVAFKAMGLRVRQGGKVEHHDLEDSIDYANEAVFDENGDIDVEFLRNRGAATEEETEQKKSWIRKNGLDPFHPSYTGWAAEDGEELFSMLYYSVLNNLSDIILVDSIPAILPKAVLAGEPGDATYGARAKLLSEELPRLKTAFRKNTNTTVIFINQVRENIGAQVKSTKPTGGFAVRHFMDVEIKIQKIGKTEQGDDVITESIVKNEKNRFNSTLKETIVISGARGLDTLSEILGVGIDFGFCHKAGNWHYFFENPVDAAVFKTASAKKQTSEIPGYLAGMNGEAAALDWMRRNGWEEKLFDLAVKAYTR